MRLGTLILSMLGATLPAGCDRSAASTAPSDATHPDTQDRDLATDVQHSYVGRSDDDEDRAGRDEDRADDAEARADAESTSLTVEAALTIVSDALDEVLDPSTMRLITPALPPSWPLEGSTVAYLVYPLAPAERGVDRYKVTTPSHRVELDVSTRQATVRAMEKPKKLPDYDRSRPKVGDPIGKAEQALLDLAAGRVQADKVHYLLFGYGSWFETNGTIGADARKYAANFADWASTWGR